MLDGKRDKDLRAVTIEKMQDWVYDNLQRLSRHIKANNFNGCMLTITELLALGIFFKSFLIINKVMLFLARLYFLYNDYSGALEILKNV